MNISGIIELEKENEGSIILHREGLFWRAYEQSAYFFCNHIKAYQVKKKFYKNLNAHIAVMGFPDSALDAIFKAIDGKSVVQEEKLIKIGGYLANEDSFLAWKEEIKGSESTPNEVSTVAENQKAYSLNPEHNLFTELLQDIRKFPVVSKTPIECQQFIIELQKQLHGTIQ